MIFTQNLTIPSYMVDRRSKLRPYDFMNFAQEIAELGADGLDFGRDKLAPLNDAWVLYRMRVDFINTPKWKDEVRLDTWHNGIEGPFFIRHYQMYGPDGQLAVAASSSWVVLNLESRQMVRISDLGDVVPFESSEPGRENIPSPSKVVVPRSLEPVLIGEKKVCYSDVDQNFHANNVRYVSWAMDLIPEDVTSKCDIKSFSINFNHEILPGETVTLKLFELAQTEEGNRVFAVDGTVGNNQAFVVKIEFIA